jgi:uncharacterized protein YdiU (UPF0061 family)
MTAPPEAPTRIRFDNSYARLPSRFYARLVPTPVARPRLIKFNQPLAEHLGIHPATLSANHGIDVLAGNRLALGSEPIAQAYAGHQFGGFQPMLGDGRALLLGEVIDRDGVRRDIQLKGSGPTPFSRRGDGRAALGPVLREYIVSEAMAALGIPTTRALAAVETGETVLRETPLPGAVLTRVAASHIRVGTFQYFSVRRDVEGLRLLADHVIDRHYPAAATAANRTRALLDAVIARQADLVARWMLIGFIHGVMNTDNTSIAGETIDYGPCAFMDTFHPATVYSFIDRGGRYAYANQPAIAQWNLARLAETLLPLLADDETAAIAEAEQAINAFPAAFEAAYAMGMRRKLGLHEAHADDLALGQALLDLMAQTGADFTRTFRHLADAVDALDDAAIAGFEVEDRHAFQPWLARWRARIDTEAGGADDRRALMRASNPAFIPRNHLVEEAIAAATTGNDFAPFETLVAVLARPYDDQPEHARYTLPPRPEQVVRNTFCGT